jgi:hypothetical protein
VPSWSAQQRGDDDITSVGGYGTGNGLMSGPTAVAFVPDFGLLVRENSRFQVFTLPPTA